MSPNAVLEDKIKRNRKFVLALEEAKRMAKETKNYLHELKRKIDDNNYIKIINQAIMKIQELKKFFNNIDEFYERIDSEASLICREIRDMFNQMTKDKILHIKTTSKSMLEDHEVYDLKIIVENKECCFMFIDNSYDFHVQIHLQILDIEFVY